MTRNGRRSYRSPHRGFIEQTKLRLRNFDLCWLRGLSHAGRHIRATMHAKREIGRGPSSPVKRGDADGYDHFLDNGGVDAEHDLGCGSPNENWDSRRSRIRY